MARLTKADSVYRSSQVYHCTDAGVAPERTCRPRHEREEPTQWEGLVLPGVTPAPDDNKKTSFRNLIRFLNKTQSKVELT